MADYKKYAENLIGNWNTDQYEPLRDVTLNVYRTNWDKLQNDFDKYLDKVNRNLDLKRENYYNSLANIDRDSVARVGSAVEDLGKRGLLNSGVANRYIQANTAVRGNAVNNALADIVNTNNSMSANLADAVTKTADKENTLNANLAASLAGITGREQANAQGAANLAANIAGNAEARDMNNALVSAKLALSGSGSSKQKEADEAERRMLIYDTIRNKDMSDNEKVRYMSIYLDVPEEKGKAAIKAYNDNQAINDAELARNRAYDRMNTLNFLSPFNKIKWSDLTGTSGTPTGMLYNLLGYGLTSLADGTLGTGNINIPYVNKPILAGYDKSPVSNSFLSPEYVRSIATGDNQSSINIPYLTANPGEGTTYLSDLINREKIRRANADLANLTYTDLYNLLYGNNK